MIRNIRRIRKEKKIFDPSDFDEPVQKKRVQREPTGDNGIKNTNIKRENGSSGKPKIRQCTVLYQ